MRTRVRRGSVALLTACGGLLILTPAALADAGVGPRPDSWLPLIGLVVPALIGVAFVGGISWLALRRFAAWRRQPRPISDEIRKEDAS
jgi:hypothetical protein